MRKAYIVLLKEGGSITSWKVLQKPLREELCCFVLDKIYKKTQSNNRKFVDFLIEAKNPIRIEIVDRAEFENYSFFSIDVFPVEAKLIDYNALPNVETYITHPNHRIRNYAKALVGV